ncbi:MAG TPA: TonB-dependent receptor plug domain-containing protein, partial [Gemmatimonadales bacterium]|nr:TonB-dependent receptor plug domain-containing protein [Gemmatimonadales bacterium]
MHQVRRLLLALGLLGAAPLTVAPATAQQPAAVTGRITNKESGQPIPAARVYAVGTTAVTQTNEDGRYTLRQVGTGTVRIRVNAIGYQSETVVVEVGSEPVTADIALEASVVQLNEIVTTATGEQNRLEVPNAIGTIAADSVAALQPVTNVTDVLNSRVPGVTVQTQTGTVGGASRVRIRGANSISLSNEPVVIVDGAYVNSGISSLDDFTGGQSTSRLNDAVNPDDIESIEVVKGPSASTLYGSQAANGVIVIKTKRGRAGRPTWNFSASGGLNQDKNSYPVNYDAFGGFSSDPASQPGCMLLSRAEGDCVRFDSLTTTNPLRDPVTSPLGTGTLGSFAASVAGGTETVRYYIGGEFSNSVGVWRMPQAEVDSVLMARNITELPGKQLRPNATRNATIRSTITADVAPHLQLGASFGYTQSRTRLPQNDNNILGVMGNALLAPGYAG